MWHRVTTLIFILKLLALTFSPAHSQETHDENWTPAIGLTSEDKLVVQVFLAKPRLDLPPNAQGACDTEVTIDVVNPATLTVISSSDPVIVKIGEPLTFEYAPNPGPPPAREEVSLRTIVRRMPAIPISSERVLLPILCPVCGSGQLVEKASGRTFIHIPGLLSMDDGCGT